MKNNLVVRDRSNSALPARECCAPRHGRSYRIAARQGGFTLVELMISLVLFSFAVSGVLAVAVSMSQGFREQRAAIAAETAARVPLDFLVEVLRQASPAAPTGNIQDASTCTGSVLGVLNNQTGSGSGAPSGWDRLEVIYAAGAVVTSTLDPYDGTSNVVRVNDPSQLAAGDYVVLSNTAQGHLFMISNITGNQITLSSACAGYVAPPGGKYTAGSLVIRAQHAFFSVGTVDGIPTLMMDPDATGSAAAEPLAEGIEDLQIVLGVDSNGDGKLGVESGVAANDDEWQGNNIGDTALAGTIRAVRVTLIARTTSGLIGNSAPFSRPAVEDHAAGSGGDKFRRRILRSTVEVRNMAGSP